MKLNILTFRVENIKDEDIWFIDGDTVCICGINYDIKGVEFLKPDPHVFYSPEKGVYINMERVKSYEKGYRSPYPVRSYIFTSSISIQVYCGLGDDPLTRRHDAVWELELKRRQEEG